MKDMTLIDDLNQQSDVSPGMKQKLFQISGRRQLIISKREIGLY